MEITESKLIDIVVDIGCDICGNTCKSSNGEFNMAQLDGDINGNWWHCDLCPTCVDRVVTFIESLGGRVEIRENYEEDE